MSKLFWTPKIREALSCKWKPENTTDPRAVAVTYQGPGFNCDSIINANCDFSPRVQLLEHNYYAMIDLCT